MRHGNYYRMEVIEVIAPQIIPAWTEWLDRQQDPGNYDAYKQKDQSILPYIDGRPRWVCDVYMPPEIEDMLPESCRKNEDSH